MRRRVYVDEVGPFIKHEGYIWRPLGKIHITGHPGCDCKTTVEPGAAVEVTATMGSFGPGIMSVRRPGALNEHWTVRWDPRRKHEVAPGKFQGDDL